MGKIIRDGVPPPAASQVFNDSSVDGATVRDALESLSGEVVDLDADTKTYGQLYTLNGSASQGLEEDEEEKLTLFTTAGPASDGVVPDTAENEIRVAATAEYLVLAQFSITSSTSNTVFTFCGAVEGVSQPTVCTERKIAVAFDVGSCSILGLVAATVGDVVSINVTADKDTNLTLKQGQLVIRRVN